MSNIIGNYYRTNFPHRVDIMQSMHILKVTDVIYSELVTPKIPIEISVKFLNDDRSWSKDYMFSPNLLDGYKRITKHDLIKEILQE